MGKRRVSLNIMIEGTPEQFENEDALRELCMCKMYQFSALNTEKARERFKENVTIELFDNEDEEDEVARDFLVGKEILP